MLTPKLLIPFAYSRFWELHQSSRIILLAYQYHPSLKRSNLTLGIKGLDVRMFMRVNVWSILTTNPKSCCMTRLQNSYCFNWLKNLHWNKSLVERPHYHAWLSSSRSSWLSLMASSLSARSCSCLAPSVIVIAPVWLFAQSSLPDSNCTEVIQKTGNDNNKIILTSRHSITFQNPLSGIPTEMQISII